MDENQHRNYNEVCECARISEIVGSIGGKSVIFIRFNPDKFKFKNVIFEVSIKDKLNLLVDILKKELVKDYEVFIVKVIQLYYDSDIEEHINEMNITNLVSV